jgi:hypothetical protein
MGSPMTPAGNSATCNSTAFGASFQFGHVGSNQRQNVAGWPISIAQPARIASVTCQPQVTSDCSCRPSESRFHRLDDISLVVVFWLILVCGEAQATKRSLPRRLSLIVGNGFSKPKKPISNNATSKGDCRQVARSVTFSNRGYDGSGHS